MGTQDPGSGINIPDPQHWVADPHPYGSALFLEARFGSAYEWKAGSESELMSNIKALEVKNSAVEPLTFPKESWRLKMEPWRNCRPVPVVADSHHLAEELNPDPHWSEKQRPAPDPDWIEKLDSRSGSALKWCGSTTPWKEYIQLLHPKSDEFTKKNPHLVPLWSTNFSTFLLLLT
jgi:hypothetical protein